MLVAAELVAMSMPFGTSAGPVFYAVPSARMTAETILQDLMKHPAMVGVALLVLFLGVLVSVTGNIEKLHGFGARVRAEWQKRRTPVVPVNALADELEKLKRHVRHVGIRNNIPVELHNLREFFLAADLVSKPGFSQFFSEWLSEPIVVLGKPVLAPGLYTTEALARLMAELEELRL
jgi:hypothetical protein